MTAFVFRTSPNKSVRPGHMARIGKPSFHITDNTHCYYRRQLYAACERAPWGWEERIFDE